MQKVLVALVTIMVVAVLVPHGAAPDQGSKNYVVATVVRVNHGIAGVTMGTGPSTCGLVGVDLEALTGGCIGGASIPTSEAQALIDAGEDPDTAGVATYLKAQSASVDALSGPNVHSILCVYNPEGGNVCEVDGSGSVDGNADAAVEGCGTGLVADATEVHAGNWWAQVFMGLLWVDPTVNEVCLGTQGEMVVLFYN